MRFNIFVFAFITGYISSLSTSTGKKIVVFDLDVWQDCFYLLSGMAEMYQKPISAIWESLDITKLDEQAIEL